MAKVILVLAFGLFALVNKVNAKCTDCSPASSAACLSETTYDICLGGEKIGQPKSCASGLVCTTEAGICKTPGAGVTVGCPDCNTCGGTPEFACVSSTQFVVCDNSVMPSKPGSDPITCPDKKYCNYESYTATPTAGDLCTDSCSTSPTCPDAPLTPVTPVAPGEEYKASCDGTKDKPGLYPNKSDPSCKTYVYCEQLDVMYAFKYTCPANLTPYFNTATKQCVAAKPPYCT